MYVKMNIVISLTSVCTQSVNVLVKSPRRYFSRRRETARCYVSLNISLSHWK